MRCEECLVPGPARCALRGREGSEKSVKRRTPHRNPRPSAGGGVSILASIVAFRRHATPADAGTNCRLWRNWGVRFKSIKPGQVVIGVFFVPTITCPPTAISDISACQASRIVRGSTGSRYLAVQPRDGDDRGRGTPDIPSETDPELLTLSGSHGLQGWFAADAAKRENMAHRWVGAGDGAVRITLVCACPLNPMGRSGPSCDEPSHASATARRSPENGRDRHRGPSAAALKAVARMWSDQRRWGGYSVLECRSDTQGRSMMQAIHFSAKGGGVVGVPKHVLSNSTVARRLVFPPRSFCR